MGEDRNEFGSIDKAGRNVDNIGMKRDEVIQILKRHRAELTEQFGVGSLALFGSVARDEASTASDVDVLVEFDRPTGYFELVALQNYLAQLLNQPVDLGTLPGLKPRIRVRIDDEILHVF